MRLQGIVPTYPAFTSPEDMRAFGDTGHRFWAPISSPLEAVERIALADPGREALVDVAPDTCTRRRVVTYADLAAGARGVAAALKDLGLGRDDTVALLTPILAEAFEIMLGAPLVARFCPVNPFLAPDQITRILAAAKTRVIVAPGPEIDPETWSKAERAASQLRVQAVAVGGAPGAPDFETFRKRRSDHVGAPTGVTREMDAALMHTGGSTGLPKLVRHTQGMHMFHMGATAPALEIRDDDALPLCLPLFHIGGSIIFGLIPLGHGARLVLPGASGFRDKDVVNNFWHLAERERISLMACVPTVLAALNEVPIGDADLSALRLCITGGATVPVETCRRFAARSGMRVVEGYGMTEAGSYVTMHPPAAPQRFGTAGAPLPGVTLEIRALDSDAVLPRGQPGRVIVRAPCVTPGYGDGRVGSILEPGVLDSGDLGRIEPDGSLTLMGRAKDIIIRGGHNIDPVVIEETLVGHPSVSLAAAVGRPDAYAGELPMAYVTVEPGTTLDGEVLQQWTRARIPERAATPVEVVILPEMPLTAVGKIFKPALRADAAERTLRPLLAKIAGSAGAPDVQARLDDVGVVVTVTPMPGTPEPTLTALRETLGTLPLRIEMQQADPD
ncbi:MAG: AMP-binding protein [Pararhodobacter sp.]